MLLKRLISIGGSKAVVIPCEYLEYYRSIGKPIEIVGLEVNRKITIEPIFNADDKQLVDRKGKTDGVHE